ncbi:MAG: GntP family permease [Defluviitaleaceae bacterium]|nr:GntP family permease [Defluviitaleaceae bacterium]
MYHVVLLFLAVVLLLVLISKFRLHTFLSLLLVSILLGIFGGLPLPEVVQHVAGGFGAIMQSIGIVIVAGVIIGEILEVTGGARRLANAVLKLVGVKNATVATAVTGGVVSVPVFCDAGFAILNPAIKAISRAGKIPYMCLVSALMMGLLATHALTPPTPGPIAAAGILGADLGIVMLYGLIVAIAVIFVTSIFWCNSKYIRNKYPEIAGEDSPEELAAMEAQSRTMRDEHGNEVIPSLFKSVIPILVPIVLIVTRSFSMQVMEPSPGRDVIDFFGTPFIALLIGVGLAFFLPRKFTAEVRDTWITNAIKKSAEIVILTGIAGSFGRILQNIGVGDIMANAIAATNLPAVLLPFIISCLVLIAQGSATVAMATTSAIILPLLPYLGISPELAVISIAGGSFTGVFPQGSYFWVVTKMAGYDIKRGYVAVTATSFIMGGVALVSIFILSLFVA